MAVYLSAQEKADIFKEACSENCLIHVHNYFGTRNGLVDLERYRAHNRKAICEDGVVGIGPREKVDEVFNHMERHIDEVYKHLHSDPYSVSSRAKFAFNIVTPEALRYAVCKVLKVSYGAAKFIVIFGYRERLDGDLMGPTDKRSRSKSQARQSSYDTRDRRSRLKSQARQTSYDTRDRRSRSNKSQARQSSYDRRDRRSRSKSQARQSSYDTRDRRSRSKSRAWRSRESRSPIPKTARHISRQSSYDRRDRRSRSKSRERQSSYDASDRRSRSKSRARQTRESRSPIPKTARRTSRQSSYDTRDRRSRSDSRARQSSYDTRDRRRSRSKSRTRRSREFRSPIPKTARRTSRQSSYDTKNTRSRSKSQEFHILVIRRAPVNKKKIPRQQIQSLTDDGFTITQIVAWFNVDLKTIYHRVEEYGISKREYSEISEDFLYTVVRKELLKYPHIGLEFLNRHLQHSLQIRVQRWRLRQAVVMIRG